MIEKYLYNDLENPKYLFYGSCEMLDIISPKNEEAIMLYSSFVLATARAFKEPIIKNSIGYPWEIQYGYNEYTKDIYVRMNNVVVDDELESLIYVFDINDSFEHKGTTKYLSNTEIKPVDIVKIKFKDFKKYYEIY